MSYGIKTIKNNAGQVLISEDTKNLHFSKQILSPSAVLRSSTLGNYSKLFLYTYNGPGTPTPFFRLPSAGSIAGITRVTNTSYNVWEIELIFAGDKYSIAPEVYIFLEPQYLSTTDTYGIKVINSDNVNPSFDSRLLPLAISATAEITHSAKPCTTPRYSLATDECQSGLNAAEGSLAPNSAITYAITGTMPQKPLFLYYSIAQAQQQVFYDRYWEDGDLIQTRRRYRASTYWAFYRGAIGANTNSVIADWAVAASNCVWRSDNSYSTLGGLLPGGGNSNAAGLWPYSNETINPQSVLVSIAPGEFYDYA
jgi:hypothetical protein